MKIKLTAAESSCRWTLQRLPVGQVHYRRATEGGRLKKGLEQHQLREEEKYILHHPTVTQKGIHLRSCAFSNHPKSSFCNPWIPKSWIGFLAPGGCVCSSTLPWPPPPKFVKSFQLNSKRWPYAFTSLGSLESFRNAFFAKNKKKSHFLNTASGCLQNQTLKAIHSSCGLQIPLIDRSSFLTQGTVNQFLSPLTWFSFPSVKVETTDPVSKGIRESLFWSHYEWPWPGNTRLGCPNFQGGSSFTDYKRGHESRQL